MYVPAKEVTPAELNNVINDIKQVLPELPKAEQTNVAKTVKDNVSASPVADEATKTQAAELEHIASQTETPAIPETPANTEAPASAGEEVKPAEKPKPAEQPKPVEKPKPAEQPKPAPKPAEKPVAKPVETPKPPAEKPAEQPKPAPKPAEKPKPTGHWETREVPYTETVTEYVDETVVVTPARTEKVPVAVRDHYTSGKAKGLISPWFPMEHPGSKITRKESLAMMDKWWADNADEYELYYSSFWHETKYDMITIPAVTKVVKKPVTKTITKTRTERVWVEG